MNINQILHGLKGLTKSITKIKKTPDEIIKERLEICSKCDKRLKFTSLNFWKCDECKCIIEFKVTILDEHWKLKKW